MIFAIILFICILSFYYLIIKGVLFKLILIGLGSILLYSILSHVEFLQNLTIFEIPAPISITGLILLLALFMGD